VDRPPPDPKALLAYWMEWERGETLPGRVMSNLKTGGLRDLLEQWVAAAEPAPTGAAGSGGG
jgi:hypothetical protein